jgi:hypothetical protein
MSATSIRLSEIKDGGAQMRVEIKPEIVRDYADDMLDGAVFPPVILYQLGRSGSRRLKRTSGKAAQGTPSCAVSVPTPHMVCAGPRRTSGGPSNAC